MVPRYAYMKEIYEACENHALNGGPDPMEKIDAFARR